MMLILGLLIGFFAGLLIASISVENAELEIYEEGFKDGYNAGTEARKIFKERP